MDTDNWQRRRKYIRWTLLWSGATVTLIVLHSLWTGRENSMLENIAIALLALFASTIGSYVFGAVWDDQNKSRFPLRGRHRAETRVETVTPSMDDQEYKSPVVEEGP